MNPVFEPITIELAYIDAEKQHCQSYQVDARLTIKEFLETVECPTWVDLNRLGVWGKKVTSEYLVKQGDRVELYRPLVLAPQEARRLRAKKRRLASK